MTESTAEFIKRVRPQVSQYETTLIEALDRLEKLDRAYNKKLRLIVEREAECERLRGEVSELKRKLAIAGRPEHGGILRPGDNPPRILTDD